LRLGEIPAEKSPLDHYRPARSLSIPCTKRSRVQRNTNADARSRKVRNEKVDMTDFCRRRTLTTTSECRRGLAPEETSRGPAHATPCGMVALTMARREDRRWQYSGLVEETFRWCQPLGTANPAGNARPLLAKDIGQSVPPPPIFGAAR